MNNHWNFFSSFVDTQHTHHHPPHDHAPHVHVYSGPLVSYATDQVSCLRCGHRPTTKLNIIPTHATQSVYVRRLDPSVLAFSLSLYRHPSVCILFRSYCVSFNKLWTKQNTLEVLVIFILMQIYTNTRKKVFVVISYNVTCPFLGFRLCYSSGNKRDLWEKTNRTVTQTFKVTIDFHLDIFPRDSSF
jgi:hypothetical protein